jgi:hypothetical protein
MAPAARPARCTSTQQLELAASEGGLYTHRGRISIPLLLLLLLLLPCVVGLYE